MILGMGLNAKHENPADTRPIGLIAGQGQLPVLVARGIREAGRSVACVGLKDQYAPELPGLCDRFAQAGIIQLGRWIRLLTRWDVQDAVMIGRVQKARMYEPMRLFRQRPDWRAIKLWYRVLRHDKRNAALLACVADELARGGVDLMDSTTHIQSLVATEGVLTGHRLTSEQAADIVFGWPLAQQTAELDIGQSIAVKDREVIAVEAIEGTDAMIRRAGALCRMGRWTLVKTARANHDMRFDVPTVGPDTITNLHQHGATCLVVQSGRVILADKPELLALANRLGITVVGRP
jgi:DUF1009 family protein